MTKMIFVNLPVAKLAASKRFYDAVGFTNNPQFSDDTTAYMVWSEATNVMLLTHAKWRKSASRPIPPTTSSEGMLALSCDSREAVDAMNETAAANGGAADINPVRGLGFMYNRNLAESRRPHLAGGVDEPGGHSLRRSNKLISIVSAFFDKKIKQGLSGRRRSRFCGCGPGLSSNSVVARMNASRQSLTVGDPLEKTSKSGLVIFREGG